MKNKLMNSNEQSSKSKSTIVKELISEFNQEYSEIFNDNHSIDKKFNNSLTNDSILNKMDLSIINNKNDLKKPNLKSIRDNITKKDRLNLNKLIHKIKPLQEVEISNVKSKTILNVFNNNLGQLNSSNPSYLNNTRNNRKIIKKDNFDIMNSLIPSQKELIQSLESSLVNVVESRNAKDYNETLKVDNSCSFSNNNNNQHSDNHSKNYKTVKFDSFYTNNNKSNNNNRDYLNNESIVESIISSAKINKKSYAESIIESKESKIREANNSFNNPNFSSISNIFMQNDNKRSILPKSNESYSIVLNSTVPTISNNFNNYNINSKYSKYYSNDYDNVVIEEKPITNSIYLENKGDNKEYYRKKYLTEGDINRKGNPIYLFDYIDEIYQYYLDNERLNIPEFGYLSLQNTINERTRPLYIDWMVAIQDKLKLLNETLYLAINLLDRVLSVKQVYSTQLQILSCACLLVASKYEEIYCPEIRDFILLSENNFSKEELKQYEYHVLSSVEFNLNHVSGLEYLRRFNFIRKYDYQNLTCSFLGIEYKEFYIDCLKQEMNIKENSNTPEYQSKLNNLFERKHDKNSLNNKVCSYTYNKILFLSQYIFEVSFLEYKMLRYTNLQRSLASFILARKIILKLLETELNEKQNLFSNRNNLNLDQNKIVLFELWDSELEKHAKYKLNDVIKIAKDLFMLLKAYHYNNTLVAIQEKFSSNKYFKVSLINFEI